MLRFTLTATRYSIRYFLTFLITILFYVSSADAFLANIAFFSKKQSAPPAPASPLMIYGVIERVGRQNLIQLYARSNIPDLSIYKLNVVQASGTSAGQFTLSGSATQGSAIYIGQTASSFNFYYGFYADFIFPESEYFSSYPSGEGVLQLYQNNVLVDVFGDINQMGYNLPWSINDGWAQSKQDVCHQQLLITQNGFIVELML